MNWNTIRNRCESTPFRAIELGDSHRIEVYWSAREGVYGYQCYGALVTYKGDIDTVFYKTNGGNYCKESHTIEHLLSVAKVGIKDYEAGSGGAPYHYRVGGNYFNVPVSDIIKY